MSELCEAQETRGSKFIYEFGRNSTVYCFVASGLLYSTIRKPSRRCLVHKLYLQNLTHHCTTDFERRSDGMSELMTFLSNKKVVTNDMESATTTLAQRVGFEPTGDCSHDGFRVHAVMTSSVPLHINLVKLFYTVFIILSILQVIIFCDKIFLLHTMEISYGCYY